MQMCVKFVSVGVFLVSTNELLTDDRTVLVAFFSTVQTIKKLTFVNSIKETSTKKKQLFFAKNVSSKAFENIQNTILSNVLKSNYS